MQSISAAMPLTSPAARAAQPAQAFRAARPSPLAARRRHLTPCRASAEAEALLASGKVKYENGDRMGALKLWEQSMKQDPTREQRLAALFNATCVHASFGDLELAQIPLKEAIFGGLDFPAALAQQDGRFVKLTASAQIKIQLNRFNEAVLKAKAAGPAPPLPPPSFASGRMGGSSGGMSSAASKAASGGVGGMLNKDMSDVLSTDADGIDASILGIVKRVLVLILGLSAFGTALFYLGLKYAFPDINS